MNCCLCKSENELLTINGVSYYCSTCISSMSNEWKFAFDRVRKLSDRAKYNKDLNLWVEPDGRAYRESTTFNNKGGTKTTRSGGWMKFHDNGTGYMIANISVNGKYVAVTMHRLIYSTFKEISYSGNYLVGHFDDDCKNNSLDNLYGIYGSKKEKQNTDHKKCAYKLLEMYVKGELYDSNGNRLSMGYDLRLD